MTKEENIDIENRIIEAAERVFVEKGFEETKMGDIAKETGICRTALNYYYRNKELLFEAVFNRLKELLLPNIAVIVSEETDCRVKISKFIDLYCGMILSHPHIPRFIINEVNRDPKHLYQTIMKDKERLTPILLFREQILGEMEKGLLKKVPILHIVSTMMSLIIFPVLVRAPLSEIFCDGDKELYGKFLHERVAMIKAIVLRLVSAEEKQEKSLI